MAKQHGWGVALMVMMLGVSAQATICDGEIFDVSKSTKRSDSVKLVQNLMSAPIAVIRESLDGAKDPVAVIVEKDLRGQWFRLEALARVCVKAFGVDFEPWLAKMKAIEDQIGAYTEKLDYLAFAEKMAANAAARKKIELLVATEKSKLQGMIGSALEDLELFSEFASGYHWPKPQKLLNAWSLAIRAEIKKTALLEYDMSALQAGVHEMRRRVRWILIYFQTFRGWMVAEWTGAPLLLNEYSSLRGTAHDQGPFSQTPRTGWFSEPVVIPRELFLGLSKVIVELGAVKSLAENIEMLAQAVGDDERAMSLLEKAKVEIRDAEADAEAIRQEMLRTGILNLVRDSFPK